MIRNFLRVAIWCFLLLLVYADIQERDRRIDEQAERAQMQFIGAEP